jgi:hypothetical protein
MRWLVAVLVAAVAALAGSVAYAAVQSGKPAIASHAGMMGGSGVGAGTVTGPGMMGGTGMMGSGGMMGTVWLAGNGSRVASIPAARSRATTAASSVGLHPGEVIWFDNGFYVELKNSAGDSATEVIVDPGTGAVYTEPGPAMMWNTRYGMHGTAAGTAAVDAAKAQQIASAWLAANLPGHVAQPPDAYLGYYTMETTTAGGTVNGMLSVNANTGAVWYHSWHGRFIAREDP